MNNVDYQAFHEWLKQTKTMSDRVKRDNVSRLRRANSIYPLTDNPDAHYVVELEQTPQFQLLTMSVRSQLKRAVALYAAYLRTE
jgi:DNA (cytosine-5)-methyltransferase 1